MVKMKINHTFRTIALSACTFLFAEVAMGVPTAPSGKEWRVVTNLTDEFESWDSSKWWKSLWNYGEPVQMRAENSGVSDGNLWIKATLDDSSARWFETSRVMSKTKIRFPMYTECSMRTADISAYNTFWLNNGNSANRDEFDICENNSNPSITSQQSYRPYTMYSQYFIVKDSVVERKHGNFDNRNLSPDNPLKGVKWNEAYHTLGAWWIDKNNIQFYLDGEPAGSVISIQDFTLEQNIIWDLWTIDASWAGGIAHKDDLLDDSINTMYVDWIHTYELVDAPYKIIPIDTYEIDGSNLILGFTNGPANSYFALFSKTNLMDVMWTTNLPSLPIDATGAGSVTNPVITPQEFYQLWESPAPYIPPAGLIEFNAPDYNDGPLNGQQNWNAEAGWSVADAAGAGYASTAANSDAAVLNEPILLNMGQTYSLSINLQFGGTYATPTDWAYTFLGGLKDSDAGASVGTGSTAADANIQIFANADTYRLLNNYAGFAGANNISGTQLNAGDILQFDYALTLGANAAGTTYTVRLQNLTDGTDTGAGTATGVDASIYNALTGSGAYGFFQSITPGQGGSGLSGVQVNSVDAVVIP